MIEQLAVAATAFPNVMSDQLCERCRVRYLDRSGKCECRKILAHAPGDPLNCADLTREAAIEVVALAGGTIARIILAKLESGRRPGGPEHSDVIAWLCENGFAWRPRNATSEARLTPKGQKKAQSVLIHVSAGNY